MNLKVNLNSSSGKLNNNNKYKSRGKGLNKSGVNLDQGDKNMVKNKTELLIVILL